MGATKNLAEYVHRTGINLSVLSRNTGIPYRSLYDSLGKNSNRQRDLRADELLSICSVLQVSPMDFKGGE